MGVLDQELKYYYSIKADLLRDSEGKYVLIKNEKLIGKFESVDEAYARGIKEFGNVPFLIKKVVGEEPVDIIPFLSMGIK